MHHLFMLLAGILFVPMLLALVLLFQAETVAARLVALVFPLLWLSAVAADILWRRRPERHKLIRGGFGVAVVLSLLLLGGAWWLTPDGRPLPGASARQVYLHGGGYRRLSPANLVPEVDQLNFGVTLLSHIGGLMPGEDASRIRRLFQTVYREMDQSAEFRALGSNLNYCYRELFLLPFDSGHTYVYIPATPRSGKKLPVILFLHGSLGNFKGYLWVLKALADRHPCAVVAPSFGDGNWNRDNGEKAVERTLQWITMQPQLDDRRVYLACISNGGRGLLRAAIKDPFAYRGLISISGYLEEELVQSGRFVQGWAGRPILVMQGKKDERVPPEDVERAVSTMSLNGLKVTYRNWPEEDHFLFFSARSEVIRVLDQWLSQN